MRKSLPLILAGMASVALAADDQDKTTAPSPAQAQPAEEVAPDQDSVPAEGEEAEAGESESAEEAKLFAELEAAAAAAAKEEREKAAKVAAERAAAKGEKLESLKTIKGKVYNKVTIRGVDDLGVRIMHQAGTARIKFADCPLELQERFGYDPGKAKEQLTKEQSRESERTRRAIARLRAEAGKPLPKVVKKTTPRTTPTTKPVDEPEAADLPIDEGDAPDLTEGEVGAEEVADIPTLQRKIAVLEAGIDKIKKIGDQYEAKAKKVEDRIFSRAATAGRDPELSPAAMKEIKEWRDKADAEFDKIAAARRLISKHRKTIKKLERNK